jgi:meiotically up-regulated gene 157 (Mug157) protein
MDEKCKKWSVESQIDSFVKPLRLSHTALQVTSTKEYNLHFIVDATKICGLFSLNSHEQGALFWRFFRHVVEI